MEQEVLDYCNEARQALFCGKPVTELKLGIPQDCEECVIARTIGKGVTVGGDGVHYNEGHEFSDKFDMTKRMILFITKFDQGDYPELEI